jgi:hypothetical protein
MTLPPSQIVSMIVFVRTQTEALISAVGIPDGEVLVGRFVGLTPPLAGVVTEAGIEETPKGIFDGADEAIEEEDGGVGLLTK